MNNKKSTRTSRSRSGGSATESDLLLTTSTSRHQHLTDSASEHCLSSAKNICQQPVHSQIHHQRERGAIGDASQQLAKCGSPSCSRIFPQTQDVGGDRLPLAVKDNTEPPSFSDPVFRKLSRFNGEVNRMNKAQLQKKLAELQLHTGGVKEVLKKRLKNQCRRLKLSEASLKAGERRKLDFLLVIDFEATCQQYNDRFVHEIIEFPAVLVNVRLRQIVGTFREYCKPVLNPVLSEFCTQLTGVDQPTVDSACVFPEVLEHFEAWLLEQGLGSSHSFAVVTDGPWDIQRFLSKQCEVSGVAFPAWGRRWINVRKAFCNFYELGRMNLEGMLGSLGLSFQGRPHCGLDDSLNIAAICCQLLQDGCWFKINEAYDGRPLDPKPAKVKDTGDGLESCSEVLPAEKKSVREMAHLESEEEVADLMYYFHLQNS